MAKRVRTEAREDGDRLSRAQCAELAGTFVVFTARSQETLRAEAKGLMKQASAAVIRNAVGGERDAVFEVVLGTLAPGVVRVVSVDVKWRGAEWSDSLLHRAVVAVCPGPEEVEDKDGSVVVKCGASLEGE